MTPYDEMRQRAEAVAAKTANRVSYITPGEVRAYKAGLLKAAEMAEAQAEAAADTDGPCCPSWLSGLADKLRALAEKE